MYIFTHKIGHVILKLKNSVFEKLSKIKFRNQEKETDAFSKKNIFQIFL